MLVLLEFHLSFTGSAAGEPISGTAASSSEVELDLDSIFSGSRPDRGTTGVSIDLLGSCVGADMLVGCRWSLFLFSSLSLGL